MAVFSTHLYDGAHEAPCGGLIVIVNPFLATPRHLSYSEKARAN